MVSKNIQSSFKWRTLTVFSVLFLNGLFIVILSRLVEKEIHGVFVILNTITVLSLLLTESGIGSSLVQKQNMNKFHIGSGNILAFSLSGFLFLMFVLFSDYLVSFYDNKFTYWNVVLLSSNIVINSIRSVSYSLLVKKFEFKKLFFSRFISLIVGNFLIGVPLAINDYGIWAFIFATISMNLIFSIALRILTPESLFFKIRRKELKDIISFGIPSTGIQLLTFTNRQLDKLVLGKLFPVTNVAIYEKGFFVSHLPSKLIGDSIDSPLFSYLSINFKNREEQFSVIFRFLQATLILSCLGTIIFYFFPYEIIYILLGSNWYESAIILKIFSVTIPFLVIIKLIDVLARSNFKLNYSFYAKAGFSVLLIASMVFGYEYGIEFVSKLIASSIAIYAIVMIFVGIKILNLKKEDIKFKWYPNWIKALGLIVFQLLLIFIFTDYRFLILGIILALNILFIISEISNIKSFLKLKDIQ